MRKLIIAIAIATISSAAHAGQSRSLSMAAYEAPQTDTAQTTTERKADVPVATAQQPKPEASKQTAEAPVADKPAEKSRPVRKPVSVESRVIYELHRHGVYW